MSVFSIHLEACDPARNQFRAYQLNVIRDLFGAWLVEVRFGRIGARGRTLRFIVDDEPAARRMVRERMQRRNGAPGRIGVPYRTLELRDPHCWMCSLRDRSRSTTVVIVTTKYPNSRPNYLPTLSEST